MVYDVVIIGGGPAGLTAGIYACRAGLKSVIVETGAPGGQAATTELIDNYPGFPEGISGPELMINFYEQAQKFGCEFKTGQVQKLALSPGIKSVVTDQETIDGKTIIVATGSQPRELGIKGEKEFRGRGVSYCATCDGFFFRNKKVAVVGGGDAAVKEAIYLANLVEQVTIIHRRDAFRADKVLGEKVLKLANVKVLWETTLDEIIGSSSVERLRLHHVKTQESQELLVNGVFMYVGTQPNTEFLGDALAKNAQGYLVTDDGLRTSVAGVFAIGDCREKASRQVATAVGDGAQVLPAVEEYIHALEG